MPCESERIQHGARHRVLRPEPAARVEILADESAQMVDVARPQQIAQPVGRGDRIALQYRREILRRIVAAAHARHIGDAWMPQPIHERLQGRREPTFARVGNLRGVATERCHRQHPVGLTADAQRRQRTERTHVRDEVLARPRDRLERKPGAFESNQIHQIVAPRRRPERGGHLLRVDLLDERSVPKGAQRRVRDGCVEAECSGEYIGVAAARRSGRATLDAEAARVHRILRRPTGRRFGAVVGRRADPQEAKTPGVVMRVEQRGDRSRRRGRIERRHAEHHERIDALLRNRRRHLKSQRHAVLLGVAEVDHPAHAFVQRGLVVRRSSGVVWIRPDRGFAIDRRAKCRRNQRAARSRDGDPALRHRACQRRALPGSTGRILEHCGRRELRLNRQGLVGRDRRGWPVADIGGTQRTRNPRGALRIEAIAELLPR